MEQIPDFWRTEVWHPLSVHMPLALLIVATIFKLIDPLFKKLNLNDSGNILLITGTLGAWIAIYTGDLADGIVSRQLCDPTILKDHENAAYIVGWLFAAASAITILDWIKVFNKFKRLLRVSAIILMLIGTGFLTYTGHLGAQLVYQQGAGVYHPSEDCAEFD